MVGAAYHMQLAFDLQEDDLYWCMSDIGWMVGHTALVYGPWAQGITVLVREGAPDYPSQDIVWATIEKYGVTKLFVAPTTLRMFMKFGPQHPQAHTLDSLRLLVCAGEPLNPEALLWAREHIGKGNLPICDNWWQTETASPTIGTLPCMEARVGRVGKAFPGYTARVVDRTGRRVAIDVPHDLGQSRALSRGLEDLTPLLLDWGCRHGG